MASTITVTATIQDPSGTALQGNAFLRFRLRNFSGFVPQISGTSILPEIQVDALPIAGAISQTLWPNNAITPSTTFYTCELWNNGRITSSGNYIFNANTNLNTASQLNAPPVPAGFSLMLENNGTLNSSQSTLNLVNTDGTVVITDLGSGNLQLNAASSGFAASGVGGFWAAGLPMATPYVGPTNGAAVGTTIDQISVFQFSLTTAWTIRTVSMYLNTGAAGGSMNFGIYTVAGNKLLDSGAMPATGSAQVQSVTLGTPVTLPTGTYYFAISSHVTSATVYGFTVSGQNNMVSVLNANGSVKIGQAANSTNAGVMPATLGTITVDTLHLAMPAVFFGV